MALGTGTLQAAAGGAPSAPLTVDVISFPGDAAYPAGGTAGFQAYVRALLGGQAKTLLAVIDVGKLAGHYAVYDHEGDKLQVFVRTTGVEAAPAANLSASTFRLAVVAQ